MSKILPTTKAQVSGHKFLVRRMRHALVLGDISMIHDPLASRRRALIFGIVAVLLIALGSGLLAWLRPDPDPGQAELLSSEQGQLYVRVDDVVHPVANLASARLILGTNGYDYRETISPWICPWPIATRIFSVDSKGASISATRS